MSSSGGVGKRFASMVYDKTGSKQADLAPNGGFSSQHAAAAALTAAVSQSPSRILTSSGATPFLRNGGPAALPGLVSGQQSFSGQEKPLSAAEIELARQQRIERIEIVQRVAGEQNAGSQASSDQPKAVRFDTDRVSINQPRASWGTLDSINEDMEEQEVHTSNGTGVLRSKAGGIGKRYASIVHETTGNRSHAVQAAARHDPSQPLMLEGHEVEWDLGGVTGRGRGPFAWDNRPRISHSYPPNWAPARFSRSFGSGMYTRHPGKGKPNRHALEHSSSAPNFRDGSTMSKSTGFGERKSNTLPSSPTSASSNAMRRSCPDFFSRVPVELIAERPAVSPSSGRRRQSVCFDITT
eukprot:gnl/TRDRNA2_/TRDRNA2_174431_c2_seq1.p1 gnl/TRDRNA2_/TRDRNA2_174431_c2~~gnl/TRDRNA2_/TRDRNA2_174431_c2_seq1.p1  ORF type:complete len:353 (+),score=22.20 gnl/TRDRNA2_/TRDRNA2_174431_c2_seq1:158-1216(+)